MPGNLVADANGVAFGTFKGDAKTQVLRKGFYLNVHEYSAEDLQAKGFDAVSCGNLKQVA